MASLNGNYIDLIIIVVLIYFGSEAWRVGFWVLLADFFSFFGSLLISLRTYKYTSDFLKTNFNLPISISNALGFLLTAIVVEGIMGFLLSHLVALLPAKLLKHKSSRWLAVIPALGEGLIITAFVLTLILGLPIRPAVKKDISNSKIGSYLIKQTAGVEKKINEVFGGVIDDSLTYLTIHPGSKESVPIKGDVADLKVDAVTEAEMFKLVNEERRNKGVQELVWAPFIVPVARNHAFDMWRRNYFSHYSPEGKDVGDRLNAVGIKYSIAGENLALAPTLQTAHTGLMNSEGHRANILEPRFKKVGIGVVDDGYYGKMFVQVFTD